MILLKLLNMANFNSFRLINKLKSVELLKIIKIFHIYDNSNVIENLIKIFFIDLLIKLKVKFVLKY